MKKILSFLSICIIGVLLLGLGIEVQETMPDNALIAYNTKTKEYFNPLYLKETDNIYDFVLRRGNEIDSKQYKPNHEHVEQGFFMGGATKLLFNLLGHKANRPWGDKGDWGIPVLALLDVPGESLGGACETMQLFVSEVPSWWNIDLSDAERNKIEDDIAQKHPKFKSLNKKNEAEQDAWWAAITEYYLVNVYPKDMKEFYAKEFKTQSEGKKQDIIPTNKQNKKIATKNALANLYLELK